MTERRAADYTAISFADAREQWLSISQRVYAATGKRQVDFLPVEVVMCLAAMFAVNHRRFGGSTSHLAPSPVPELAALFKRTPASLLAKMANLDGSRANGGRFEMTAASQLLSDTPRLVTVYVVVMDAAASVGLDEALLPDILQIASFGELVPLESDADRSVMEREASERARSLSMTSSVDVETTERLILAVARIGQHNFARDVLHNCGYACVFCGLEPRTLARRGLLRASHIKPWSAATDRERLATSNGLAACPTHDAGFDRGLLSVADDLRILRSPLLRANMLENPTLISSFGSPPLAPSLILPTGSVRPSQPLLRFHRERIAA